jgi:hypothetical protein
VRFNLSGAKRLRVLLEKENIMAEPSGYITMSKAYGCKKQSKGAA